MSRTVSHFSCGAASAIATKLLIDDIDEIWYAETGAEDPDNKRFMLDCQEWFGREVRIIRSEKYSSTWDVWEKRRYLAGIAGAPCTSELKIKPRQAHQRDDDTHVFGYTADSNDRRRATAMRSNWPELSIETPLIDRGLTKQACLGLLASAGIAPPRVYALGLPNANCIPCVKAQSPRYWALIRKEYPDEFQRMALLSSNLGVRLAQLKGKRIYIDEIPHDMPTTEPLAPACDFLCGLAEQELAAEEEDRAKYALEAMEKAKK